MVEKQRMSLEEIRAFLQASEELHVAGKNRNEIYSWMEQTLVGQQYHRLKKEENGLLRSYLGKLTGLSRAQVRRLIGQYLGQGHHRRKWV